jgi:hypothetical protein
MRKYLALGVLAAIGGWAATRVVRGRREKGDEATWEPAEQIPSESAEPAPEVALSEDPAVAEAPAEVLAEIHVEAPVKPRRKRAKPKRAPRSIAEDAIAGLS